MARYVTSVRSDRPPADAFAFVADLSNLTEWDPGVSRAVQVAGDGPEPDAAYDVTIVNGREMTLRYETVSYEGPRSVTLRARASWFTSTDVISVRPTDEGGSVVTYDATLRLRGVLGVGDLALRPIFNRIGDKAAAGLRRSLDGTFVS